MPGQDYLPTPLQHQHPSEPFPGPSAQLQPPFEPLPEVSPQSQQSLYTQLRLVGSPLVEEIDVNSDDAVSLPVSRPTSPQNDLVDPRGSNSHLNTPPLPLPPPQYADDFDGADEVELPPSRVSSVGSAGHASDPAESYLALSSMAQKRSRITGPANPSSVSGSANVVGHTSSDSPQKPAKQSGGQKQRHGGRHTRERQPQHYHEKIQRLVNCMPHLKQLHSYSGRFESVGLITRLEYAKSIEHPRRTSRKTFDSEAWTGNAYKSFAKRLAPNRAQPCSLRLLLVEDLSRDLILVLGSQYAIDPEAFATHISMSGFDRLSYTDLAESRWITAKMNKSSRSIKWYRPVRLETRVISWLQTPETLAELGGDGTRWSETSYERRDEVLVEKKTKHHVKLNTNTFRQSRPLSTRPHDFSKDSVPGVWEERATVFLTTENKLNTSESPSLARTSSMEKRLTDPVIILLDPLPSFVETREVEESEYTNGYRMRSLPPSTPDTKIIPAFAPLAPRTPIKFPANKFRASEDEIEELEARIADASSTSADLESWIWQNNKQITTGSKDPIISLLRLAYIDTVDYLENLGWTLDEIIRDSLDEFIMTRRLPAWRKLLNELEIEIPALGHSLRNFVDRRHAAFAEAQGMLDELDYRIIPEFLNRVRAVHAALRSEMALLDSSRGITEARTMARLTELAFVFIPLTFVSSLFSMQVTELEAGLSLWVFVLTALGLGVFTYGARGLLQSDLLRVLSRRAQKSPLVAGRDPTSHTASTAQIIKYAAASIWRHSQPALDAVVFASVLALPVVPIAFMWSRNTLHVGLHVVMTLLILPPGVAVAYFAMTALKESTRGEAEEDENKPGSVELSFFERFALATVWIRDKSHPLPPPPPPPGMV
jgi:hypothetical protein